MKVIYLAVLAAAFIFCLGFFQHPSRAQGTPDLPQEQWYASVTTTACAETGNCTSCDGQSCRTTTFQVPSSGTYILIASVSCSGGGACSKCLACANIYKGSDPVAHIHTTHCGTVSCSQTAEGFTLFTGVTYTLCICKYPCPDPQGNTCASCPNTCTAMACVAIQFGGGGCGN